MITKKKKKTSIQNNVLFAVYTNVTDRTFQNKKI